MLSVWICSVHNPASQYSRQAYVSWKKKLNLSLQSWYDKCGVIQRNYVVQSRKSYFKNCNNQRATSSFTVSSSRHVFCFLKYNFQYAESTMLLQKRFSSSKHKISKLKKSFLVALFPEKLKNVYSRFKYKQAKPLLEYAHPSSSNNGANQNFFDFPKFFGRDNSLNSTPQALHFRSTASDPTSRVQTAIQQKCEQRNDDEINTVPNSDAHDDKIVSTATESSQNKDLKKLSAEVDDDLESESSAIMRRSQYEHLLTSLASKESTNLNEEKSIFSSLKSYVESPVNSFFSFLSRTNAVEKSSNVEKLDEMQLSHQQSNNEELQDINSIPPPRSLLEILYQYIPYVSNESTKEQTDAIKQKEVVRLKAQKELLHQTVSINNRTRYLLNAISASNSLFNLMQHVEELKDHLLRFPDTRITAVKQDGIKEIMHVYRTTHDQELLPTLRMVLAMLGVVDPPKMKGIRLLSIDGGGSRGLASVEICRRLEELTGRPIYQLFDYICGVSTGAVVGFGLGVKKLSVDELGRLYREMSCQIFNQSKLAGTGGLMLSHSYYSTEGYQKIMKDIFGHQLLIETSALEDVPKCSAVSTLVNRLPLKPFLWRNYSIVPGTRDTHWSGTCRGTMWEAVRASSAAPGYFEEFKKGYNIHQDGGVLTNNPTGVALNECRLLWPNDPIQCVVSIGTGRYEPVVGPIGEEFSSLKDKLMKFVDSATNVTEVHKVMYDLLPTGTYFRFNPFIDEPLLLDENRPEKMDLLVENTKGYVETNDFKFRACANALLDKKLYRKKF